MKTPKELIDIYFNSVGKNGVLLLNIPPDKRGLINESDVQSLRTWKQAIDQTFSVNLAKGATIKSANGSNAKAMLDDDYETYWTTNGGDTTANIEFDLRGKSV